MIQVQNNVFYLNTEHTSYVFYVAETGHLEHLYYGKRLEAGFDAAPLVVKHTNLNGCAIAYDTVHNGICMNDRNLEISGKGTGDMREVFADITFSDGSTTVDFLYVSHEILEEKHMLSGLPSSYDENGVAKTLVIRMREKHQPVFLDLYYSVFESCNVIVRSCILNNKGEQPIHINRLMSAQLDIPGTGYQVTSFHGDWANEMNRRDVVVAGGCFKNTSRTGFSSNHANPFMMLFAEGSSEEFGEGYGCNLIYSGPHMELVDVGSQGQTRLLTGISLDQFSWTLASGESFETPEAVLTYSDRGYRLISERMHAFVREHIVRGEWKYKERPILLNSWEASYFNITEHSLLKLAKAAKETGIELFVMDDGWFGERKDDHRSLGDWTPNKKKLPGGLESISKKVEALGLMFGVWVEPEMVNEDSDLHRAHPDWAVKVPGRTHSLGRNQMLLDMTRKEVQDYVIRSMKEVFSSGKISYVKWDMNRNFSDVYSLVLGKEKQKEFHHRYILGLYRVLKELTETFPHILFESCASGGNRVDLGMLCYMPQVWASDNTDAICRCSIQNGLSYGYPQSVVGAHVSSCPNHQTLRTTPLATRYAVASAGLLGYECNLAEMKASEREEIKKQIENYKKWRKTLQYGTFYRLGGKVNTVKGRIAMQDDNNLVVWNIVSPDRKQAVVIMVQDTVKPHTSQILFRGCGLKEDTMYHFYNREVPVDVLQFGDLINMIAPIHIKKDSLLHQTVAKFVKLKGDREDYLIRGDMIQNAGISLSQSFAGTGMGEGTRIYQDFGARMYYLEEI